MVTFKQSMLANAAVVCAVFLAPAAHAQEATADHGGASANDSRGSLQLAQASQARSSSSASVGGQSANTQSGSQPSSVEEIVVTAEKREERLQNVPISVAVVTGKVLDRSSLNSADEALTTVAGVSITQAYQGAGTLVTVRGVAAGGPLFGGASPISYYVDSVPFGLIQSAVAPDAQAFDLQQVEVLRGPQGTLYGSSAENGVVRILTNDANLNSFDFKARASDSGTVGGGNNYQGDMAVNVPIIDGVLAARAVLGYENDSGWIDTPGRSNVNDAELTNARFKVNAQPIDNLTIGLSAWISRSHFGMPSFGNSNDFNTVSAPQPVQTDFDAYGLKVGYKFPDFTVTSATSYFDYSNAGYLNLAPLGYFISPTVPINLLTNQGADVTSEEVNFASTDSGDWRWSGGGMFRRDSETLLQADLPTTVKTVTTSLSTSYAVYGELTRVFFDDKLEFTAGVRHFIDDQSSDAVTSNRSGNSEFKATTPRFVITLHPDKQSTIYASYSQGFRSGLVQPKLPASLEFARPDLLTNYEVGAKGTVMNGFVSYDAAAYYIDWKGVQQLITVPVTSGGITIPTAAIVNSGSASGPGVDLSLTVRPVENLTLSAQFSWNNLTFDQNVVSAGLVLFPKGSRLNFSPEYTAGGSATYEFPLGSGGWRGRASISGNFTSPQSYVSLYNGVAAATGNTMFVARADFSILFSKKWGVTVFVDNLTNDRGTPVATPYLPTTMDWNDRIRPLTAGLRLTYGL